MSPELPIIILSEDEENCPQLSSSRLLSLVFLISEISSQVLLFNSSQRERLPLTEKPHILFQRHLADIGGHIGDRHALTLKQPVTSIVSHCFYPQVS